MTATVRGFRFNGAANLADARAFGAIADGYRWANPMTEGELVVVLAKRSDDTYLAQIGIATGEYGHLDATTVWPDWAAERIDVLVQGVRWFSDIVVVPAEIACRSGNRMSDEHAQAVFSYVMSA